MSGNQDLPLLGSEKSLLAARGFSPHQDPFVGLAEVCLKQRIHKEHLSQAYQAVISGHTAFHLLFEKRENIFIKTLQPPVFKDIKEFKSKQAFLLWKNKSLDFETGPLREMALYKTFFKSILCFKFHHLILDGFSLALFFKKLTTAYYKSLSGELKSPPETDLKSYQRLLKETVERERADKEIKAQFWKKRLKAYAEEKRMKSHPFLEEQISGKGHEPAINSKTRSEDQLPYFFESPERQEGSESFFLKRKHLKKIFRFQAQANVGLFYFFASLYSKALYQSLGMDFICLRVPFSARYHLKQKEILASLSRSAPLFICDPSQDLKRLALSIQQQSRSARERLIMGAPPWAGWNLNSFSKRKNQNLSLSMSYMPYTEKGFLGRIQNFSWQKSFLDLALFIILSEKRVLLSFSYKPEIFSKAEIRALAHSLRREIEDARSSML